MSESCTEIKLEHVNPLLRDYEVLIRTLSEQLEFYKEEQNHLKSEVVNLLDENKVLSSNIKELLDGSETVLPVSHRYAEGDFVENLKSQINFLLTEKESAVELWRNSLSTIDQLEEELRLYEGRNHGYVSKTEVKKIKSDYEKQLKQLQVELIQSKTCLLKTKKSSNSLIDLKDIELQRVTEMHENTIKEVEKLESDVRKLQQEQEDITKKRNQLQALVEEKNKVITELRIRDSESKAKVSEAVQVVEVALMEKDSAILRENQAREELSKISKALTDVVDGTNEKLKSELEDTKKQYKEKLHKIKNDMKNVLEQLKIKDVELEKQRSMSKILENELQIMRGSAQSSNNPSKSVIMDQNLEATFQKLLESEKKNVQVEAEKAKIREELEEMTNYYKNQINERESEKVILLNKISSLQRELETSNVSLKDVATKVDDVNSKISLIEDELKRQLQLKDLQAQKTMASRIREIEEENAKMNNELKERLESQVSFNQKWKVEVRTITKNLEDHVHELRAEALDLKRTNAVLSEKLLQAEQQAEIYQNYLQRFCLDISNVVALTKEQSGAVLK